MSTFLFITLEVLFWRISWRISSIISQGIGTEVNKPEVLQSFLLTIPEDMNGICFPKSHYHFKIIKSPHNGISQLHQHSQVQHIIPYEYTYDQVI